MEEGVQKQKTMCEGVVNNEEQHPQSIPLNLLINGHLNENLGISHTLKVEHVNVDAFACDTSCCHGSSDSSVIDYPNVDSMDVSDDFEVVNEYLITPTTLSMDQENKIPMEVTSQEALVTTIKGTDVTQKGDGKEENESSDRNVTQSEQLFNASNHLSNSSISDNKPLEETQSSDSSDQSLITSLQESSLIFPTIEKQDFVFQMIRGVGNCFYRAFAFSFLKVLGERERPFRMRIWNHFIQNAFKLLEKNFTLLHENSNFKFPSWFFDAK